jgi:hypothetical protein
MSVSCECCVSKVWSWSLEKWGGLGPQGAVKLLWKKIYALCNIFMRKCLCKTQHGLDNKQVHNPLDCKPLLTARRQQREDTWTRAGRWSTHNSKYLRNVAHLVSFFFSPTYSAPQPMSVCGRTVATNSSALYMSSNSTVVTATATTYSLQTHENESVIVSTNSPTSIQRCR